MSLDALRTDAVTWSPARELLTATGTDRVSYLHRIVTANVAGAPAGGGVRAVLLSPKGHVVADMWILVRADDVRLVVPPGQGAAVAAALARYAVMDDVSFAPLADARLLAVLGPRAEDRLRAAGVDASAVGAAPLSHAEVGGLWLVRVTELGAGGFWLVGPAPRLEAAARALADAGVPALALDAAEAARIAAREPRFGAEITEDVFPMEVGLGDTIDYGKGCYLGQEPIVRIRDRGHVNRRLVRVRLDGVAAAAGDLVETDAKPKAGHLTSAVPGAALALLHVSIPDGATVRVRHGDTVWPAIVEG